MSARGIPAAFALAALFAMPPAASAAIVENWHTASGVDYDVLVRGMIAGTSVYNVITRESSGTIGIRSAATGALLGQTALTYSPNQFWFQDLDADGPPEMIILDGASGKYVCFNMSTLAVRWSTVAFAQPVEVAFVDFDGNGKLYTVFMASGSNQFRVYDRNGVLVSNTTIPTAPTGPTVTSELNVYNFNGDTMQQLLIDYNKGSDDLYFFQSSAGVGVGPSLTAPFSVELGPSYPNPTFSLSRVEYSTTTTGSASLRLFDVSGREVRTLVDGPVSAGRHDATWDGRDAQGRAVPPGAYFYELRAGGQRQTRRVVRLQ